MDELLGVAWTCRRWRAAVQDDCLWMCTRFSACDGRARPELEPHVWGGCTPSWTRNRV